ncbi:MAG: right-handed parallel beta-helix repeat-containing protein [Ruminococcus sp.]|nr:right-handed parallel beta-helix repeat-containing protein [Ruminococcus sp.]
MKKYLIKLIPFLLIILTMLSLGLISVSAAVTYTNSKGSVKVVCGSYKKTFKASSYKKNFSAALNAALETARKKATDSKRATVTISKGHYKVDRTIKVYSNTTLVATGSYFRYYGNLLRNGFDKLKTAGYGYNSAKNITIKGGEWEQLIAFKYAGSSDTSKMHSTFRFAHCNNIKVTKAGFKNNYNCHDIEIAGVKDSEFSGNNFYNTKSVNTVANNGGRESVQIDVATASAMPYFPSYDKTPCKNISIHENTFKNKFRAVGSHHGVTGKTYNNITVRNNKMTNIAGIAVYAVYWTNSKIYSNEMTNVGTGVDMRSMINGASLNFYNLDKLSYTDSEKAVSNSKTYIYDNQIQIRKSNNLSSKPCAIRALGDYYPSKDKETGTKAGIYRIYGVNIGVDSNGTAMPNKISGNMSTAVQLNYGVNSVVKNNIIDMKKSSKNTLCGVELRGCENIDISSNTIKNGSVNSAKGIYAYESSANTMNSLLNISDNIIDNFAYAGVYIKKAEMTKIINNTVGNCADSAVILNAATLTQISKNTLKDVLYGVYTLDSCNGLEMNSNTVFATDSGLYASSCDNMNAYDNSFSTNKSAVYLKSTNSVCLKNNNINSNLYGVCISKNNYSTDIIDNNIDSADECVYYNGASSSDKSNAKTLNITGNSLNCPASKAAVRVVYDNITASIHSNNRADAGMPFYRFKGDGEKSYRKLYEDMTIDNLTLDTTDEVKKLSWNSASAASGCQVYLGEEFFGNVEAGECTLDSYNGEKITVIPYKIYGNITLLGVPMSVEN